MLQGSRPSLASEVGARIDVFVDAPFRMARGTSDALRAIAIPDLVLSLTLVLLLLHGYGSTSVEVFIRPLCILMLVCTPLRGERSLWYCLIGILMVGNGRMWFAVDNHQYLITYWVIACALSVSARKPREFLARNAKGLVALVFIPAVAWKLIAGEYLDGSFMYHTLMVDHRVQHVTSRMAGWPLADLLDYRWATQALGVLGSPSVSVDAPVAPSVMRGAIVLSMLTISGEALIGVLFALRAQRLYFWRHIALMCFIGTTYFILPVTGFGFVLSILGMAQLRGTDHTLKLGYAGLIGIVQFTKIPWQNLLSLSQ